MTPTARTSTRVYTSPGRDTVLDAVRDLWSLHGHSPSATAVAHHTGLSRRTVRDHLAALEELGHIRRTPGKTRSIVLTEREAS